MTLSVPSPNTLTTASGTGITTSDPISVTTLEATPAQFTASVSSALVLASPPFDVALTGTGLTADQVVLGYSTNGTDFATVPLSGGAGALSGSLALGDGVPSGSSVPLTFRLAVTDDAPAGAVTVALDLDELMGGAVVNRAATAAVR